MLVFGKASRTRDPRDLIAEVRQLLTAAAREPGDIRRHGTLVTALVAAGALLQGLADADFEANGSDAASPSQDAATALLLALAGAVDASWQRGFRVAVPDLTAILRTLETLPLARKVTVRWAEGFAYYALYPEAYAVAARRSGLSAETHVLGLRSIGAPLGAMVASGLGSSKLSTVRPVGHPFHRTLRLSEERQAALRTATAGLAVVDEGPGLSGSSLGGTLDVLDHLGVREERVALFPSHDGVPGSQASAGHRARWSRTARHVVPFRALLLDPEAPEHALESWFADLVGPADASLEDISGGAWRRHLYADEASWPAVNAWQERRKYLLRTQGGIWRLKFAGLGPWAVRQYERAEALAWAGLTPQVLGLRHGFLLERWHADARPLCPDHAENARWIDGIGRYLALRATAASSGETSCDERSGASLAELLAMARHNIGEALGPDRISRLDAWTPNALAMLSEALRIVDTDNRMQPWKWLALPDGRLLKSDAIDHHAGHDLVGCQDIAWDIVGVVQEFGFSPAEQTRLAGIVEAASGRQIQPRLLALLTPCYLAFQVGALTLAHGAANDPAEGARLMHWLARQTARLRTCLGTDIP